MTLKSLVIDDLSIGYKSRRNSVVLHKGLNAYLRPGEITCLLGPNGSGKSTLIRTIAGLQPAINGAIIIQKNLLSNLNVRQIAKIISIVLTHEVAAGGLTVLEMVAMGRSPYTNFLGKMSANDRQIIGEAIMKTGASNLTNRKMSELSDGERQRVMIAKSLAQRTDVILLDEPTAFLDFPGKLEILQLLRKMAQTEGKTILLSTHDLNLAIKFADQLWLMNKENGFVTGIPEDMILDGFFADFFDRENIRFDLATGEFKFSFAHREKIAVKGEGLKTKWLINALERKGFAIDETDNAALKIEFHENQFILQDGKNRFYHTTIAEIIEELNNINQSTIKISEL